MPENKANARAGYHQFQADDGTPYGSFEVFWDDADEINGSGPRNFDTEGNPVRPGWYWWACFPGFLPESEAIGPFETSEAAWHNAMEG